MPMNEPRPSFTEYALLFVGVLSLIAGVVLSVSAALALSNGIRDSAVFLFIGTGGVFTSFFFLCHSRGIEASAADRGKQSAVVKVKNTI